MKGTQVAQVNVPKFLEISLELIYKEALSLFPDLIDYFPHYDDSYVPPWNFFWSILQTLKPQYYKKVMDACYEKRFKVGEEMNEMEMIEIRPDVYNEIMNSAYFGSKSSSLKNEKGKPFIN